MQRLNLGVKTRHTIKYAPRQLLLLLCAAGFVALLYDRVNNLDITLIGRGFMAVSGVQWVLALFATAVSFLAVGRYDAVLHRALSTGVCDNTACRAGYVGIAISQTLGMGLITGALARWRLLPNMSLWQATRLSATVALSFLAGWAVVTGAVLAALPITTFNTGYLALLPIAGFFGLIAISVFQPNITIFNKKLAWPSVVTILSITALTAVDTVAAAAALYVLLPDTIALPFSHFYPVFLLSLGGALISGTPGGVGPFEVAMLALLPSLPAEPILASVLAFRAAYYALPAIIAGCILAKGCAPDWPKTNQPQIHSPTAPPYLNARQNALIHNAQFAEGNLLRQGGKFILCNPDTQCSMLVAQTGQAMVALRDPLNTSCLQGAIKTLSTAARSSGKSPVFYKCSARFATHLRKAGYAIVPIAHEAVINPQAFSIKGRNHRQLRRKLSKPDGLKIIASNGPLPLMDMAQVSSEWVRSNHGERGFSMGIFSEPYLLTQRVILAYSKGVLVGFISLNTCEKEWSLDLMRHTSLAPEGTMHALVVKAIDLAKEHNLTRLSLAAIPYNSKQASLFIKLGVKLLPSHLSQGGGLRQFKTCFAPRLEPLYFAAPNYAALCLGGFDIAQQIVAKPHAS